ncbi:hypothetical protein ACSS6W_003971 [Trichoderma asperelloides]
MEPTIHKVDPNGDTLLILRNPNAPFAGDATVWPDALPKYRADRLKRNERELELIAQVEHPTPDGPREVHFQLSSKHLALASRYFRALVANRWKEASSSCGFAYTVTAEDWDEAALLMVMKIIHCQTSEIPQDIDSEMVAKMTVIVDYYQCTKAISFSYPSSSSMLAISNDARRLSYEKVEAQFILLDYHFLKISLVIYTFDA